MIQAYKYLHGMYGVDTTNLFRIRQREFDNTHGHHLKLAKSNSRLNFLKNFFMERCINT